MKAPAPPVNLARPPLALSVASFVSTFDRFAVSPMLVVIAMDLRVSLAASVAAASGYYLAYGLTQPLWGLLSDRYGRVRVMRGTLYGAALAGVASALMPALGALVLARVVTGACFGAVIPAGLTYVGDTVHASVRQRALTDLMGISALGTAMATGLAGVVADLVDWRVAFLIPALCALGCALSLRSLPEPPRAEAERSAGARRFLGMVLGHRWALLVFGLAFTEGAIMLGSLPFLATALQHTGVAAAVAGFGITAYGLGLWLVSKAVKRLSGRWPTPVLMAVGGAQICAGFTIITVQVNMATVTVTALLLGGGWSFLHSSLQTWATSVVPGARGTTIAFFAASLFVGSAVASWAAGPLAEAGRYPLLFGLAAAAVVPLTVIAALSRRRYGRPENPGPR
ncbi:MFS transporter [Nonomuraea jiangxiensis]|uniref:Predicted arabinose efflux permease, MFS family n=1 Tax=Nonomuraea jiangxiensis TaxID=633440 RepID=A0A1G9GQS1_9ACTN|nr:MFS transporter [Nonomuraea jiangxiensis]SDL03031.1 Predicted arabinose efflux permease, MFS family [Nonomuraea jiangxiensis]